MSKHPAFVVDGERGPSEPAKDISNQPPAEEDLGGGDICSPEVEAPTEDDKPL